MDCSEAAVSSIVLACCGASLEILHFVNHAEVPSDRWRGWCM